MTGYRVFIKKEIDEILKTSKKIVLPFILLFFGFTSPLTARYINEIIKNFSGIDAPEQKITYISSFAQYFKNIGQIGIIAVIMVFMGVVIDEKVKGSVILVLTKAVTRTQFIVSKFISSVILFTAAYVLSAVVFGYYTYMLFPDFNSRNIVLSLLMIWVNGVFIISVTILASTLGKSHAMSAVISFITFAVVSALSALPKIGEYLPGALNSLGMGLVDGTKMPGDIVLTAFISGVLTLVLLIISVQVFKRQEL